MNIAGTAVAVDIGGTFTDLAIRYPDGSTGTAKALTTPGALADGVVDALRLSGADGAEITFFVHGTTAGLNALLERKYATVGLITTAGFRDVYEIGRANRPEMYDLHYHRPAPLVRRELRMEVRERMTATGEVLIPLDEDSLRASVGGWSTRASAHSRSCSCTHTLTRPTSCAARSWSGSGTPSSRFRCRTGSRTSGGSTSGPAPRW